jgi:hypothetical protein
MLVIQPYDKTSIQSIEKAIMASDLGLTPGNDGNLIRINVPQLTAVSGSLSSDSMRILREWNRMELPMQCLLFADEARFLEERFSCCPVYRVLLPRTLTSDTSPLPMRNATGSTGTALQTVQLSCMQDRRKEMAKLVSKLGEDGKVAIRYLLLPAIDSQRQIRCQELC